MKVLLLLAFDPWPPRSGIAHRLDALSRVARRLGETRILLFTPRRPTAMPPGASVEWTLRSRKRGAAAFRMCSALVTGRPLATSFYSQRSARALVRATYAEFQPDLVLAHGSAGIGLAEGIVPLEDLVLDMDSSDPETHRRVAEILTPPRRWHWAVDAHLMERWLRRRLPALRAALAVAERDRRMLEEFGPSARILTVPNGVHVPEPSPGRHPRPAEFLFVGGREYPPNRQAVNFLAAQVLPTIPEARLRIVGGGPPVTAERVTDVGVVEDLSPEWQRAVALLVPVFAGGGTRIKVLDALANGVPVISTRLGVEGLELQAEEHYLPAETPSEFRRAMSRINSDPDLQRSLSRAGRATASRYAWSRIESDFVSQLRSMVRS